MKLYVVGQATEDLSRWELTGIFDTEKQALENCLDWTYFIGSVELNEAIHEKSEWPGCYYPHVRTEQYKDLWQK